MDPEEPLVEPIVETAEPAEDLVSFLAKVRDIHVVADKVLVGKKDMQSLAETQPETWTDIMYLLNEWDYSYLTTVQLEEAIKNYQQSLLTNVA